MKEDNHLLSTVVEFLKKNIDSNMSLTMSGNDVRTRKGLQHFTFIKFSEKNEQKIFDLVMSHALQAEKRCPGSGMHFLKILCKSDLERERILPRTKRDIVEILRREKLSSRSLLILETVLDFCTSTTNLSIKKSSTQSHFIEVTDGYSFSVNPLFKYSPSFLSRAKSCCIDGYVENVSELHRFLENLSKTKEPCILFCRGMSDDVVNTLKVNFDRKTVVVYPFVVPFDLENVNTLVDLAVSTGTDVISSNKGDLISSIDEKSTGHVEFCTLSGGSIRFKCGNAKDRVKNHLANLKNTLIEKEDVSGLLEKRIRSLTASCIDIHIPDDINFYSSSQQLDEGIRIISSIINNTYDPVLVAEQTLSAFQKTFKDTHHCLL